MPAWIWGKKSSSGKKKEEEQHQYYQYQPQQQVVRDSRKAKEKTRSFDEIFARKSGKRPGSTSGFDSDGLVPRGHPLPPPTVFSSLGHEHGAPCESVSSFSSSGSSDDPPDLGYVGVYRYQDPVNTPRGRTVKLESQKQQQIADNGYAVPTSPFPDHSRFAELSTSPRGELQLNSSTPRSSVDLKFNPRSRSPGPSSRPHSLLSSPRHPRLSGVNPDSPTERQDDGKNQGHPLPLPPGSPSSSTSPHSVRSNGVFENGQALRSKWKKGRLLGRGTFGHVYVGFNSESGQMCAIKEVRVISDDQNSRESLRQLNQEIALLSQLSHPNIVQYYGSELAEETLSVYLEFVSGGSIHKLLQEYGPFKEPVIQSYTGQILSGLAYLHGRNTVHRDIKGANILVDPNGEIKLADFGMAKHVIYCPDRHYLSRDIETHAHAAATFAAALTHAPNWMEPSLKSSIMGYLFSLLLIGDLDNLPYTITSCTNVLSFKGSPYWMAPEVIMNTNGYSLAVDVWSLGCTILEMATSKPPWSQYEGVAAIFKIGNSKDIPDVPDSISDEGKNFLKLCLQRDPSARPTAVQLLDHPFVRGHGSLKIPRIVLTNDLQFPTDGSPPPNAAEFQSTRINIRSCDADYGIRGRQGHPNTFKGWSSNDGVRARANMSLPVSPCSSPLRQFGPSHISTPPHPTYIMAMGGYAYANHSVSPRSDRTQAVRLDERHHPDSWPDIRHPNSRTPDGSPRARNNRSMYL